ncbi:MAG: c-type cytochrome [Pseudomonadota bacterium]
MRRSLAAVLLAALCALGAGGAWAAEFGDPLRGSTIWKKCKSCHTVGMAARNKTGPHLNDLFGRRAASIEGFGYSKAMQRAGADGLTWDPEHIALFMANPKTLVSGTKMRFRGIKDAQDRADLLAFLRQYSANPRDIPESAPTAAPRDPDVDPAILALSGDPDYGEYLAGECLTCHKADGADEGIPSITGWVKDDFVTALHAYKSKARPHPVMRMIAGQLSNDEIASLAAYFAALEE